MLIQRITSQNNYKIDFPGFKGGTMNAPQIAQRADNFVRSNEAPLLVTIADVKNYLKQNADKILNGRIFNTPLTKDGDSLLMAFFQIKPLEEEQKEYKNILHMMSKLSDINYNQKDSMGITAFEWVIMEESFDELSLLKGKDLTYDPMLFYAYKRIKNPKFKKALLESGLYAPPVLVKDEEQNSCILSMFNKYYNVNESDISNIISVLRNNEGNISNETIVVFKKILSQYKKKQKFFSFTNKLREKNIASLTEAVGLLKDNSGNIDMEKAAHFLAAYEKKNASIRSAIKSVKIAHNLTPGVVTKITESDWAIIEKFLEIFWSNDPSAEIKMIKMAGKYREILDKHDMCRNVIERLLM